VLTKGGLFLALEALAQAGPQRRRRLILVTSALAALGFAGLPLTGGALAKLAIKPLTGDGAASLLFAAAALTATAQSQSNQLPSGVAAGDVTADSAVLWARPRVPGPLLTVVAPDRRLQVGAQTFVSAATVPLVPIKHAVSGLLPGTTYYHLSIDLAFNISGGIFRTANEAGTRQGLRFGVTGDSRGDVMPFHSLRNLPRRNLAFLALLGDTIYADVESPALPGVQQALSLDEFRTKHAEVHSPTNGLNALADVRRSTALFAVIDDHEVTNDFSGGASPATASKRTAARPN
jgi:phosphodiesterase/alkaline phosphatase D-like protein